MLDLSSLAASTALSTGRPAKIEKSHTLTNEAGIAHLVQEELPRNKDHWGSGFPCSFDLSRETSPYIVATVIGREWWQREQHPSPPLAYGRTTATIAAKLICRPIIFR